MHGSNNVLFPRTDGSVGAVLADGTVPGPSSPRTGPRRAAAGRRKSSATYHPAALGALLAATDAVTVGAVGGLTFWLLQGLEVVGTWSALLLSMTAGVLVAVSLWERGGYSHTALLSRGIPVGRLVLAILQSFGALFLIHAGTRLVQQQGAAALVSDGMSESGWETWLLSFAAASFLVLVGLRLVCLRTIPEALAAHPVVVLGDGASCSAFIASASRCPMLEVAGVFHLDFSGADRATADDATTQSLPALRQLLRRDGISSVVVALPWSDPQRIQSVTAEIATEPVDIYIAPDMPSDSTGTYEWTSLGELCLLRTGCRPLSAAQAAVKRAEDLILAGLLVVLMAPVMLIIAALIKATSRGSVFFRQKRVGFNNQVFQVLKFRTMYTHLSDGDARQQTVRGDARITRIGAPLRRSSLDELPQLLNVLRGEMSLVGPRPHALQTMAGGVPLEIAVPGYASRHRVKPGLTGWAQVNGSRGELDSVEKLVERVAYDLEYIRTWSLWLDLKIIWRTVRLILADPHAY